MNHRKGMTMVEIVVAFSVLILGVSLVAGCLGLTARMAARAQQRRSALADVEQSIYSNSSGITTTDGMDDSYDVTGADDLDFTFKAKIVTKTVTASDGTVITYQVLSK